MEIRDGISAVEQKQHNQEKEKILSWLSTIDPSFQHKQISPTRQEGTGTWLLETSLFQDWIKGHGNVLFCPGIPGAGKTVLSSMVIDHLQHRYASQGSIGITYFFFDYKNQQPTMFEIYSALLRQLIRRQSSLPEGVLSMHKKYVQNGETPSLSQMLRELTTALVACSKAFIVIDALDECPIHDGKRSVRHSVLRDLLSLCEKHQVNLLATSRPDREISACFGTGKSIEIRASLDDIKRYVDMRMGELEALIQRKPDLEHRIGSEIPKAANGMCVYPFPVTALTNRLGSYLLVSISTFSQPRSMSQGLSDFWRKYAQGHPQTHINRLIMKLWTESTDSVHASWTLPREQSDGSSMQNDFSLSPSSSMPLLWRLNLRASMRRMSRILRSSRRFVVD